MYKNKKIFILGMARSGFEVAKLLSNYNNDIVITDCKEQDNDNVKLLEDLGVKFILSDDPSDMLDNSFDVLIKNPGIRKDNKTVVKANNLNIPVVNELEVAYDFLPENISIIGITGSNGKTTTTTMVYEIMKNAGLSVHLGGNIGYPVSSLVSKVKENDILVLEISDHQLCDMYSFKTNVSALLNISETHTDFHGTHEVYVNMKKRIFNNHTFSDLAVLNLDNEEVKEIDGINSNKLFFSSKEKVDCYLENNIIYYKNEEVLKLSDIKIKGIHNYENIMAAILIVKQYGVNNNIIKEYLADFRGVEHRIEYVRTINGRLFYNDSKSTNNVATMTALSSFNTPIILLMGGLDRGISFDEIGSYLDNVKLIVGYGETKDKVVEFASKFNISSIKVNNLNEAIINAYDNSGEGDTILLSPACASWDQYNTFEERGNEFKNVVNELK